MNGEHSFRSFPHPSSASLAEMVVLHNPIQLAAISNYKLAQLTFAPPNTDSLRKTALVKNMLEVFYRETPSECLNQMTRWVFFTPESLSDMTQEGLEEIFAQYAQTIEAFQPLDDEDEDDQEADRIWEEHYMWRTNDDDEQDDIRNASGSTVSEASTIFSQPHAIMSSEMIHQSPYPPSPPVSLADKPLPQNPPIEDIPRRKSLTPSVRSRNRLSWTSDTGVALSGSMVQTMASDMMNLFDMNFSVDIKLNTAPKLPELPFPQQQCQQRKRLSNDSLMGLIPTFETFTLDDDPSPHSSLSQKPKRKSRLSQSWSNSFVSDTSLPPLPSSPPSTDMDHPIEVSNLPTRSSSLAYRKQHQQQQRRASQPTLQNPINPGTKRSDFLAGLWGAAINGSNNNNNNDKKESKNLSRSKSMRRLASLVKGTKKKASKSSPSLQYVESLTSSSSPPEPPVKDHLFNKSQHSLCSVASSTSSCSTSTAQVMVARKTSFRKPPQKEESNHDDDDHLLAKRRSFTMLRPVVVEAQEIRRARSVGHRDPSRRRLAAKMETQKSLPQLTIQEPLQPQPTLSRSKSALKKLSRGLSQRRRNNKQSQEHGMVDHHHEILPVQQQDMTTNKNTNAFVKRMTSLGRRIRLHTI